MRSRSRGSPSIIFTPSRSQLWTAGLDEAGLVALEGLLSLLDLDLLDVVERTINLDLERWCFPDCFPAGERRKRGGQPGPRGPYGKKAKISVNLISPDKKGVCSPRQNENERATRTLSSWLVAKQCPRSFASFPYPCEISNDFGAYPSSRNHAAFCNPIEY